LLIHHQKKHQKKKFYLRRSIKYQFQESLKIGGFGVISYHRRF